MGDGRAGAVAALVAAARPASGDLPAVRSAAVMALALMGDALLYLVLPLQPAAFGVTSAWIGVLLSANRFVRLGINHLLVPVARRVGLGGLSTLGAAAATLSTGGYALLTGGPALLGARLGWGVSYSALRLANLGYATDAPGRSGRLLGLSYGITQAGPLFAVTAGAYVAGAYGTQVAFGLLGAATATGIVLAHGLPGAPTPGEPELEPPGSTSATLRPERTEVAYFLAMLATDGIFMVTLTRLLVQEGFAAGAAIQLGGAVLVGRRVASLVLGPIVGRAADRWGLSRLFRGALGALGLGLGGVALGGGLAALGSVACIIPAVQTLAPGVVVLRTTRSRLRALSSLVTWTDLGAAAGALLAGSLMEAVPPRVLFGAAAALVGLGLAVELTTHAHGRKHD